MFQGKDNDLADTFSREERLRTNETAAEHQSGIGGCGGMTSMPTPDDEGPSGKPASGSTQDEHLEQ